MHADLAARKLPPRLVIAAMQQRVDQLQLQLTELHRERQEDRAQTEQLVRHFEVRLEQFMHLVEQFANLAEHDRLELRLAVTMTSEAVQAQRRESRRLRRRRDASPRRMRHVWLARVVRPGDGAIVVWKARSVAAD